MFGRKKKYPRTPQEEIRNRYLEEFKAQLDRMNVLLTEMGRHGYCPRVETHRDEHGVYKSTVVCEIIFD